MTHHITDPAHHKTPHIAESSSLLIASVFAYIAAPLVKAYVVATYTQAALFRLPTPLRLAVSLGEVVRWIMSHK
jgi:xanthine/uracil permease